MELEIGTPILICRVMARRVDKPKSSNGLGDGVCLCPQTMAIRAEVWKSSEVNHSAAQPGKAQLFFNIHVPCACPSYVLDEMMQDHSC